MGGEEKMIPYGHQSISEDDKQAVLGVLSSLFLTQGPEISSFEGNVAGYCGARRAVATNSATSALHIACLSLEVGKGDIVWTSPITFVASANCALYCQAEIDFVDICPSTFNMSTEALEQKLILAEREGRLPKVVIAVHMAGQSCDMSKIGALALRYGFKVIEDASHALGARYLGEPIGNCRFSDITVFSFHPVKIITTGEGGMAVTNNHDLADRMILRRSHGITRDPLTTRGKPDGPWYYEQVELGFNYRMTDIQAALGNSQMKRLDSFVTRRNELAKGYEDRLTTAGITAQCRHLDCYSSYHLYILRVNPQVSKVNRRQLFDHFRRHNVFANVHYIPVYWQPFYRSLGFEPGLCPEAECYYEQAITIPLFPSLSEADHAKVIELVNSAVEGSSTR